MSDDRAKHQAELKLEDLVRFAAALDLDWGRLEELRDAYDNEGYTDQCETEEGAKASWAIDNPDDAQELAELEKIAEDFDDEEDVQRQVDEFPIDISVRSGWQGLGEKLEAEEYSILLCTGGPAVRITGDFDRWGTPHTAKLEYQDWYTQWTELYIDTPEEGEAVLRVAQYLIPEVFVG